MDPARIVKKSRLRPGKMLLADTVRRTLVGDDELKERYAAEQPYGEWLDRELVYLKDLPIPNRRVEMHDQRRRDQLYKAFGYTYEDVKSVILRWRRRGVSQPHPWARTPACGAFRKTSAAV